MQHINSKILAVALAVSAPLISTSARADTWGCEVLLCLSNPAGPMAVSQCVPPIKRLYRAIFKKNPDPFPSCAMAQGPNGRSWAQVEYNNYYDSCPNGMRPLDRGTWAIVGTADQVARANERRWFGMTVAQELASQPMSLGIGEGGFEDVYRDSDRSAARKTCVGNHLGNIVITQGYGENATNFDTAVYDRIVHVDPHRNGFAIKVFVDSQLYRLVRPQF